MFKNEEQDSLRPVGVKASLSRLIENRVVTANRDPLTSYLEPEQVALTRAGGFILVHSVRILTEEMRDRSGWVTVKLDIQECSQFLITCGHGGGTGNDSRAAAPRTACGHCTGQPPGAGGERRVLGEDRGGPVSGLPNCQPLVLCGLAASCPDAPSHTGSCGWPMRFLEMMTVT